MTITLPMEAPAVAGQGQTDRTLTETEIATLIEQGLGPLPLDAVDEVLLMMAWFRAHPDALRRTTPYEQWM